MSVSATSSQGKPSWLAPGLFTSKLQMAMAREEPIAQSHLTVKTDTNNLKVVRKLGLASGTWPHCPAAAVQQYTRANALSARDQPRLRSAQLPVTTRMGEDTVCHEQSTDSCKYSYPRPVLFDSQIRIIISTRTRPCHRNGAIPSSNSVCITSDWKTKIQIDKYIIFYSPELIQYRCIMIEPLALLYPINRCT